MERAMGIEPMSETLEIKNKNLQTLRLTAFFSRYRGKMTS
jgi:hypothetical protein